jgi:hypothetical protein
MTIKLGDTLTLERNPSGTEHLYFVIGQQDDRFLLVNATSYKPNQDESCILYPGDHSFIRHKSLIRYDKALSAKEGVIDKNIRNGISRHLAPVCSKVLHKLREGAKKSPALTPKYRAYII